MRAEWCSNEDLGHLLAALMPANRLALRVSAETGLRINDVLSLKTENLSRRFSVVEQKTGKKRQIYLSQDLYLSLLGMAGRVWVFEHRLDPAKHRTRNAVYKDLRRAATLFRIDGKMIKAHVSPHSARKIFAVNRFHDTGDLHKVQQLLNHSNEAVTILYAMADILTQRHKRKSKP